MKQNRTLQRTMVIMILVSLSLAAGAMKKPDFSGTWKLNESESTLNAEFSFAPKQVVITQEKNLLTYETTSDFQGQEFTRTSKYTLDGEESKNEGFQGRELISVADWEDESIKVVTNFEMQDGGSLKITVTYSMKGDQLVIVNEVTGGPMGDSKETWVYDKQ